MAKNFTTWNSKAKFTPDPVFIWLMSKYFTSEGQKYTKSFGSFYQQVEKKAIYKWWWNKWFVCFLPSFPIKTDFFLKEDSYFCFLFFSQKKLYYSVFREEKHQQIVDDGERQLE